MIFTKMQLFIVVFFSGKHGCDRRSRWSNVDKYQENGYLMRQRDKPRYQPPRIHNNNQNLY